MNDIKLTVEWGNKKEVTENKKILDPKWNGDKNKNKLQGLLNLLTL